MRKILAGLISLAMVFAVASVVRADKPSDTGFDDAGYNNTANIFNGTGMSWCMDKVGDQAWCDAYLGPYANDKLIMKWNDEWNRGNAEDWANPPYRAWENNEWNGMGEGGSGAVWHYKIVWEEGCASVDHSPSTRGDAYCLWGPFAVIMDQGVDPNYGPGHWWFAHGLSNGYGSFVNPNVLPEPLP